MASFRTKQRDASLMKTNEMRTAYIKCPFFVDFSACLGKCDFFSRFAPCPKELGALQLRRMHWNHWFMCCA